MKSRITASPWNQGESIMPCSRNAGWAGTSDGVAARGFVNGGACRAAVGGKAPQVRTGPKSLPAGRLGRGKTAFPAGRLGRRNPQHQTQKKSPDSSLNRDSRSAAATYSPTWCSSTIGASELNFSVRDGKRWILTAITAAI